MYLLLYKYEGRYYVLQGPSRRELLNSVSCLIGASVIFCEQEENVVLDAFNMYEVQNKSQCFLQKKQAVISSH